MKKGLVSILRQDSFSFLILRFCFYLLNTFLSFPFSYCQYFLYIVLYIKITGREQYYLYYICLYLIILNIDTKEYLICVFLSLRDTLLICMEKEYFILQRFVSNKLNHHFFLCYSNTYFTEIWIHYIFL